MFRRIADFNTVWSRELESTQKIFKHLTDASLSVAVSPGGRTLARLAWHIVTMIPDTMARTGLKTPGIGADDPMPSSAKAMFRAYNEAAISLLEQITTGWTDETLEVSDDMYGEQWKRGQTLMALVLHQVHHRAQMTVLMRQAGLAIPGVFGPTREEWAAYGMKPPEI